METVEEIAGQKIDTGVMLPDPSGDPNKCQVCTLARADIKKYPLFAVKGMLQGELAKMGKMIEKFVKSETFSKLTSKV